MIKLIVSDLDGTLLDKPNSISEQNLKAIEYAYGKGAKFCFATGRDRASVNSIKCLLQHEPLLILGNGAQFYDEEGELIGEEYFPNPYLKQVITILTKHCVDFIIYTTDGFYTLTEPALVRERFITRIEQVRNKEIAQIFATDQEKPCNNLQKIADMDHFIRTRKIIKIEGFDKNAEPIEAVKTDMKELTALSYLSTGKNNVEVTSIYAQKGLVLERHRQKLGLKKDEIMVIGDSHNDLSLFETFPYSFAPKNSCDEIKQKAYRVVCSCDDHAVSEAIYTMIQ